MPTRRKCRTKLGTGVLAEAFVIAPIRFHCAPIIGGQQQSIAGKPPEIGASYEQVAGGSRDKIACHDRAIIGRAVGNCMPVRGRVELTVRRQEPTSPGTHRDPTLSGCEGRPHPAHAERRQRPAGNRSLWARRPAIVRHLLALSLSRSSRPRANGGRPPPTPAAHPATRHRPSQATSRRTSAASCPAISSSMPMTHTSTRWRSVSSEDDTSPATVPIEVSLLFIDDTALRCARASSR